MMPLGQLLGVVVAPLVQLVLSEPAHGQLVLAAIEVARTIGKTRLIEDDVGRSTSPVVDGVSAVGKAEELYAGELAGVAHAHILAEEAAAVFVHHDDGRLAVPVGARAHAAVHLAVGFDASAVALPFDAVHVMEPCAGGLGP